MIRLDELNNCKLDLPGHKTRTFKMGPNEVLTWTEGSFSGDGGGGQWVVVVVPPSIYSAESTGQTGP